MNKSLEPILESLIEAIMVIIFFATFVGAGYLTSQLIELPLIKDIIISSSLIAGFLTLIIKLKKE